MLESWGRHIGWRALDQPLPIPSRQAIFALFQRHFAEDQQCIVPPTAAEHLMHEAGEPGPVVAGDTLLIPLARQGIDALAVQFQCFRRQRGDLGVALRPRLVVADEPVSALDVSVQAQILNLLFDLQKDFRLTYLFVAHDLSVVRYISDRVAVMYVGRMVELAETEELFKTPKHPYTAALLSAVPEPDPRTRSRRIVLQGEVANPAAPPSGCYFHPRCPHAIDVCRTETPAWQEISHGHFVVCHRAKELQLAGVE